MMIDNKADQVSERHDIIARLISLSRADTLYRDLYLQKARTLLQQEMTADDYRSFQHMQTSLANLPNKIRNAMAGNDWASVHDLSSQYTILSAQVEKKRALREFGQAIYDLQEIPVDPFSPGMSTIPGVVSQPLAQLRTATQRQFKELSRIDGAWRDFYERRLQAFELLNIDKGGPSSLVHPSAERLQDEAIKALDAGNFDTLEHLAQDLENLPGGAGDLATGQTATEDEPEPPDYAFAFQPETLKRAQQLGLEWQKVPSRHRDFAPLCRFAWHPTFAQMHGEHVSVLRVPDLPLPEGTPDALKARIQLFATHPMINSAGIRFLPTMVAEDVLVEDFAEPEAGSVLPNSGLLEALGLPQRNQLSRLQIEAALLAHGGAVVRDELGLDPMEFKLVCIPPDLHLRIGMERGWGQQKIWTHFDGYLVMMNGTLRALAGGDIRYGGIYDLLGIGSHYDSDRIIARFAVVQRRRMALWP